MTLRKWKTLQELIRVLRIPYHATIALQNPRITLSDVFGIWTKMIIHLEAVAAKPTFKTELSQKLISALNNRKDSIFNNPAMECCLFLDPRFRNVILSDRDSTVRAKANLINRIDSFQTKNTSTNAHSNVSSEFHISFDEQAELDRLMSQISTHLNAQSSTNCAAYNQNSNVQCNGIEEALDSFQPDWLSSEKSVLEFWETQKH